MPEDPLHDTRYYLSDVPNTAFPKHAQPPWAVHDLGM